MGQSGAVRLVIAGKVQDGFVDKRVTTDTFIASLEPDLSIRWSIDDDPSVTSTRKAQDKSFTHKHPSAVAFTADNGLVITGRGQDSRGDSHNYLQRRTKAGKTLWTVRLTYPGDFSYKPQVAVASDDSIYVSMSTPYRHGNTKRQQPYVARYDPQGVLLWEKRIDTNRGYGIARGMAVAPDDSVLVACGLGGAPKLVRLTSSGVLTKNPIRIYSPKIAAGGTAYAVAIADDGTIYVTGQVSGQKMQGDIKTSSGPGNPYSGYGTEMPYAFVAKLVWGKPERLP